ncbi:MAG: alpha/beta hydrolase [Haliscomenobacter sp.]|uniref:alpha/beta fold hydrolase n=1 Tax=Haliscomenobacter sp. TaxID=2717303 RepID=UPI0029B7C3FE|nr:alpha/beta hydrolase [Haliscomenobacter sp.]MDX2071736.1 alpha/beta hydrolase [Haliscomenobacter sp.]
MKKISLFICFIFLLNAHVKAQNWVSYSTSIPAKGLEGLPFRLKAMIKAEIAHDSANARMWIRINKPTKMGFFENMRNRPIRNKAWKPYQIDGIIDSGAVKISFGALCEFDGKFSYDDFKLEVETRKGEWKTIFSEDFEDGKTEPFVQGVQGGTSGINNKFSATTIKGGSSKSGQYLEILGKGVPSYGFNKAAGKLAEVNGARIYYEVYGEGKPLVLLPANGWGMPGLVSEIEYFLNKKYQIIVIEPRNSPKNWSKGQALSFELMASDVNEVLKKQGVDSAYIIASDQIGFYLAQKFPDKVKKMAIDEFYVRSDTFGIEPWAHQLLKNSMEKEKEERNHNRLNLILNTPQISFSDLEKIQAEVLLINVDWDGLVRLSHSLEIIKHLPKSNLFVSPGGYDANVQNRELTLIAIENFFERRFTGKP